MNSITIKETFAWNPSFSPYATVFDKKATTTEKLKRKFQAEKVALERKVGELTIDLDWL